MGEEEGESIDRIYKVMVILGKISKVKIIKTEGKELTKQLLVRHRVFAEFYFYHYCRFPLEL